MQAQRLTEIESNLRATLEADLGQAQDGKLQALDTKLRKVIQAVASAPVEVNLSEEAKKAIVADLDRRVAVLEAAA
jgi:hypothetical protein